MKDDDWMKCAGPAKDMKGQRCYAGADFAESKDLCALVLNFPDGDKRHLKSFFWIPEKKVREKEDHVDYWVWKKQGHITVIPGDAIDHSELAVQITKILDMYNVQGITYDKYGIGEPVVQILINNGFPVDRLHPMKQTTTESTQAIRKIEEEVSLERINHEGHPVLRWNIANAVLYMDSFGGVKFNKSKSIEKIDGAWAMTMAFAEEINSAGNGPIKLTNITFV
jgi:phage terminase large subunit-like protein